MGLKEQLQKDKANMSAVPQPAYNDNEDSEIIISKFYGYERSPIRRAVMLDLRLKGGKYVSLPYSYLTKIKFDPSESIELYISGNHVKITGRNMHDIYEQLIRHRVTFIIANPTDLDTTEESETFVKDIEVKEDDS
ncbi:hypothetical protein GCM10028806_10540 [Spirosoma terrae]|uniref:Uncharacterized protein n=1 Tax=Spirosoma terrae TaxID=1968276 RepID=A0A6L9LKB1_9BACT|nr:hypothetical protein [Spirosoma terrae]NDU99238.1 hypothetical protein [Spirosoma terrae]